MNPAFGFLSNPRPKSLEVVGFKASGAGDLDRRFVEVARRRCLRPFAELFAELFLISAGEGVIALVRYHREQVHFLPFFGAFRVAIARPVLLNAEAQSAPNLLALLDGAFALVEGADRKDVRIVPPYPKG